jgi:hypothetical protein
MSRRRAVAILAAAAIAATGAGALAVEGAAAGDDGSRARDSRAGEGSILYRKGGRLWMAKPDGSKRRAVPHTKGLEFPSQDDRGRIVAQRGINFHRLSRRGKRLNKPITTAFRTSPLLPAYKGPLAPEVSPDGKKIAYTYSFTSEYYDPGCDCFTVQPSLNTSYTYSNRFVEFPTKVFGSAGFYSNASWIDNRRVLATTPNLYDYGGNVLLPVATDPLGGGDDSFQGWFAECTGCESIETIQFYPLDEGEMTRKGDKLVFTAGALGAAEPRAELFVYPLQAPPPELPPRFCRITGPTGAFSSPSWSPDGRSLAWADRRGIWIGELGDLSGDSCQVDRRLVIPGGTSPDWGPARP